MKTLKTMLIILSAFFLTFPAYGQNAEGRGQFRDMMQDLHHTLRDYHDENIYPHLLKWKEQLDNAMETSDLEKLNELRAEASKLKDKMHEARKEMRQQRRQKGGKGMGRRGQRRPMGNEFRDEMIELHEQLAPLAEKYKGTLESIAKNAEPVTEQWKEDTKEIFDDWKAKYDDEIEDFKDRRKGRRSRGMREGVPGGPKGPMMDFNDRRSVARFMLWDGGRRNPVSEDLRIEDELTITNLRNSPNPFSQTTAIRFELPEETTVKLTIMDSQGSEITTLLNKSMPAGEHSAVFNVSDINRPLPNGTYYYKLQTGSFTDTGKMILSK